MLTQGSVETVQGLMEGEAAEADFMDRMKVYVRFNTVDGRNPANQSIWRTSRFSLGFYTFQSGDRRISSFNLMGDSF